MASARLGRRLTALRTQRKLSRHALAERADISREYVRLLEAGRYDPTVTVLRRLAKALGVDAAELLR